MKTKTTRFLIVTSFFRNRPLQQFLSWVLLFSFLHVVVGCNYYRLKEESPVDSQKLASLPNYKRFILHQGDNQWELKELTVQENSLSGTLLPLPKDLLPYASDKKGSAIRYKAIMKPIALNIVHLYVYEFSQGANDQVVIPVSALNRIEITDKDTGATVASHILVGIGSLAAAFALLTIIVLLTKSSCPFVYTYNKEGSHFVGEAYGGAIFSPLERDDYMPLTHWEANAGNIQVKISNELKERQYTNLAELQVVQHPEEVQVLLDQKGQPHTFKKPEAPQEAVASDGKDYAGVLAKQDSALLSFNYAEANQNYVNLQFRKPAHSKTGKLVLQAQNSLWLDYLYGEFTKQFKGIYNRWAEKQKDVPAAELTKWQNEQGIPLLVEVKTSEGWQVVERIQPVGPMAARKLVVPINLEKVKGENVQVRLSCGFMFWEIDQVGLDFTPNLPMQVDKVKASSAFEKSGKNVSHLLTATDSKYLQQFSIGDAVMLTYSLPEKSKGHTQTIFLHTRGYYEHIRDYEGIPNIFTLRSFEKPGHFMQFSRDRYNQLAKENNYSHLITAHAASR